jgi:hypothetical protein
MNGWLPIPRITRARIIFALAVAVGVDAIQILLGPAGWLIADEVLDVIAMVLISWALGFHPLLLPTFIIELFPLVDMIPTWVGCTSAVILLRRKVPSAPPPAPTSPPPPPVVTAEPPRPPQGAPPPLIEDKPPGVYGG